MYEKLPSDSAGGGFRQPEGLAKGFLQAQWPLNTLRAFSGGGMLAGILVEGYELFRPGRRNI